MFGTRFSIADALNTLAFSNFTSSSMLPLLPPLQDAQHPLVRYRTFSINFQSISTKILKLNDMVFIDLHYYYTQFGYGSFGFYSRNSCYSISSGCTSMILPIIHCIEVTLSSFINISWPGNTFPFVVFNSLCS